MSEVSPTVVYDCMIYLQAAMSVRGLAARCLELAEAGEVRLVVSETVLVDVGLAEPNARSL